MRSDPLLIGCRWQILSRACWRSAWFGRLRALVSGIRRGPAVAVLGACLAAGPAGAQAAPQAMSPAELALLDAVNEFRASQGRAAWMPEPGLAAVARAHSQSMAASGRFSHAGFQRRAEGTGSAVCVENLLQGKVSPARAVQLWQRSSSHSDMLLEPAAQLAGVGMSGRFTTLLACATPPPPGPATSPVPGAARP